MKETEGHSGSDSRDGDGAGQGSRWFEELTKGRMAAEMGARIGEARRLRGRSRRWLADAAGVDPDTVRRIEMGRQEPRSSTTTMMIVKALDVDHEQILGGFEWVPGTPRDPGCYQIERWSDADDG